MTKGMTRTWWLRRTRTAHLSDTANDISMERSFWLDDAFASGGSNGYDRKATGITARGRLGGHQALLP